MVKKILYVLILVLILVIEDPISAFASDTDSTTNELVNEILKMGEYEKIDNYVDEYIPQKVSFSDLIYKIINGEDNIGSYMCEYVYDIFLYEISSIKKTIISMLSLIVIFTIFNKITTDRAGYISDISFFMIYTALMTMLLGAFAVIGDVVVNGISNILNFLSAVIPAYSSTLVLTGNVSTAAAFYALTVALIYILEWGLKVVIMPGIQIYVLIELLNNIYTDKQFSKLSGLLYRGIKIGLRTMIVLVGGIGGIQSMISSAKDRVNDSVILRGISLIPGIGKVTGVSGEIFVSCAVLVKSSVGAAILLLLLTITIIPVIKVLIFEITYKVMAAILQPITDKRIVDGIHSIACAGELYVNMLIDALLLFLITIATVCMTSNFTI